MARKKQQSNEQIRYQHFTWILYQRGNVFQADGRGNQPSAGRHTLGTRNKEEAIKKLQRLDRVQAVRLGLADKSILGDLQPGQLLLEQGQERYRLHCSRPASVGGPKPTTAKRYRPIFDKAITHFRELGLTTWNQITKRHLESYAAWLDGEGYAYATEVMEITTLKQVVNYFIHEGLLPPRNKIVLPMTKVTESDTYCYTVPQFQAMLSLCRSQTSLLWLADVILTLAMTGMRISELASLNWVAIDFDRNVIVLKDERRSKISRRRTARTTKSGRSRVFPIQDQLRDLLVLKAKNGMSGNVFHAPKGGALRAGNVREALVEYVIKPLSEQFSSPEDEIGFKDGRLHSFRHFFCSQCANRGIPERVVMNLLGHQSSAMIRRYYHLHDEEAQRQIKKLEFLTGTGAL